LFLRRQPIVKRAVAYPIFGAVIAVLALYTVLLSLYDPNAERLPSKEEALAMLRAKQIWSAVLMYRRCKRAMPYNLSQLIPHFLPIPEPLVLPTDSDPQAIGKTKVRTSFVWGGPTLARGASRNDECDDVIVMYSRLGAWSKRVVLYATGKADTMDEDVFQSMLEQSYRTVVLNIPWVRGAKKFHESGKNARGAGSVCIANLKQIDDAKQMWAAINQGKPSTAVPTFDDLKPYLRGVPKCPDGGEYRINAVEDSPECTIPGHRLD